MWLTTDCVHGNHGILQDLRFIYTVSVVWYRYFIIILICKAQKLGLVDAPTARLTDKEWQDVKNKSNQRNDSDQPCVICKEEFGTQHQVCLLYCQVWNNFHPIPCQRACRWKFWVKFVTFIFIYFFKFIYITSPFNKFTQIDMYTIQYNTKTIQYNTKQNDTI
jgi:hypothetical protein